MTPHALNLSLAHGLRLDAGFHAFEDAYTDFGSARASSFTVADLDRIEAVTTTIDRPDFIGISAPRLFGAVEGGSFHRPWSADALRGGVTSPAPAAAERDAPSAWEAYAPKLEAEKAAMEVNAGCGCLGCSMRPSYSKPGSGSDGITGANGAGNTELIAQTFNAGLGRYEFTGDRDTDGVLIGSRWTKTTLTYSFPDDGAFYDDQDYPNGSEPDELVEFNNAQKDAVRYSLGQVAAYTNLQFQEITETASVHGDLRFSQTDFNGVGSAYANFPSSSLQAGDVWFGRTNQPFYLTPEPGNWGQATQMHEIGHALGLKHGQDDYTTLDLAGAGYLDHPGGNPSNPRFGSVSLSATEDGQAWSLMTYRSNPGAPTDFQGEEFNQPQTYMQDDIAALQHLYGANFTTNAGASVYTWSTTTGEMSINGVGQGAPSGNKILSTLWDGNGTDTYDLSNYATNLRINLTPGEFSTFDAAQLANHRAFSGGNAPAVGNVGNARLYLGDLRSLIENATGGIGNDQIIGNQGVNALIGGGGNDELIGSDANDQLTGGTGGDSLYGDSKAGTPSGVGFGDGQVTKASGAGNNSIANAIDVSAEFSLASDAFILDSTTVPHVSVNGTGDGTKDYYKVFVVAGSVLTFDIDATSGFDSFIRLLDSTGAVLAFDDDSTTSEGAGGSTSGLDSLLTYTATQDAFYFIEVGRYQSATTNRVIPAGATYELQISAGGVPDIGGGSGNDTLTGGLGADDLNGGGGQDTLDVGVDSDIDTLVYLLAAESSGVGRDLVLNLDLAEDRFDFDFSVGIVDAEIITGRLRVANFDADIAKAVNKGFAPGGAIEAVLFDPAKGNLNDAGQKYLVIDANNDGSYTVGDFVIQVSNATGVLDLTDFT